MNASVDGRILGSRWQPAENRMPGLFERLHEQLGGGFWLIGRVTGSEYAKVEAYPDHTEQTYPREPWFAQRIAPGDAAAYGIVLDAQGKIAWGRSDIGGDPIVVVLTERVSDMHLAGLRQDGVSYIFAGEQELECRAAAARTRPMPGAVGRSKPRPAASAESRPHPWSQPSRRSYRYLWIGRIDRFDQSEAAGMRRVNLDAIAGVIAICAER
jgi:hypothetical protein